MEKSKISIQSSAELIETLKMMAQAYEEISVLKMQRVRGRVLANRDFLERLSTVFVDVHRNYRRQIQKLVRSHKNKKQVASFTTTAKNNKQVSVFISANANFYGGIVQRVFHLFIEDLKKNNSDIVILGRLGKQMYENSGMDRPYKYFDIPDNNTSLMDLKDAVGYIVHYSIVNVYYGRFNNMVEQKATHSDVSGEMVDENGSTEQDARLDYFFEPSLETVLHFLEGSVFSSMFEQTIHEAELSRLASRVKAMEEALQNIEKTEGVLKIENRRLAKSIQNKKQLDNLTKIFYLLK